MSEGVDIGKLMAAYVAARSAFSEADSAADALHDRLAAAVKGVSHSRNHRAYGGVARTFDAGTVPQWAAAIPTADEVIAIGSRWREARAKVRAAFNALPVDVRGHVKALPSGADAPHA
ncbi:hypothetical protein [Pseudogemmobacter humi]|uniref:hypothetical protein n=1 Tax=Pseudogemmobacter humi TaxID=2483812 RepID=UPI000F526A8A|nr:hypothetical protein [Pseudogemmobacter humi]